ncbi:MAG: glycosyltransferase family 4 protein [Planctomycetota bacterium]|nr:glycosyltransferase family 4 protein [Planctomycetota bacterium]
MGWECTLMGGEDIWRGNPVENRSFQRFPLQLREYLRANAEQYDVIEYDHEDLPFPRSEFSPRVLMVARSVLLVHHLARIKIPRPPTVKQTLRQFILGRRDRIEMEQRIQRSQKTLEQADLINVSNSHDEDELVRSGISDRKVIVMPFGLGRDRRELFHAVPLEIPHGPPVVAFTGTFDYRKGAREFPAIWELVRKAVPGVRLRLLGTSGLMRTEAQVRACFSPQANESIDIYTEFEPDALPCLLTPCHAGIFPSYMEGFPNGVLEMLAAALPVFAYAAPGTSDILAPEFLSPPGNARKLATKLIAILTQPNLLAAGRRWARKRSNDFDWLNVAYQTAQHYKNAYEHQLVCV